MPDPTSNLPEYSVTEISTAIKRTMEDVFGHVRLRGEISGFRGPHSSGHSYFALKDEKAKIDAIVWRGNYRRVAKWLEEGLEVIATGKVTTYPARSGYQIVIDSIEPAGVGALLAQLEERKKKLAAEGLFDDARKRPLPYLPQVVGVVTSPTGAVIRDILHRITERFPVRVLVWPAKVQGEGAAEEVAHGIAGLNALPERDADGSLYRPDLLIVARGGGSLEDLWAFNEEVVVRAAAQSAIPLISAVGHETDTTLIDFASDKRAPTPTAAAEIALPVRAELLAFVEETGARMTRRIARVLEERRTALRAARRGLPKLEDVVAIPRQRLDAAGERLPLSLRRGVSERMRTVAALMRALPPATRLVELPGQRVIDVAGRFLRAMPANVERRRDRLERSSRLLATLGHKATLARGFALVRDTDGGVIRMADAAQAAGNISVEFADGKVEALVSGQGSDGSPVPPKPARGEKKPVAKKAAPKNQGSLFD